MNLVIVESPTKIKTLEKFLGKDYFFAASYGHIRDLPKKNIGVDIEHDFSPQYEITERSAKTVTKLKKAAKSADAVFLAMDPDREGEAIAYHVLHVLGLDPVSGGRKKKEYHRVTFHSITKDEVLKSFSSPRKLDFNLFDAQQARRILDRLVGYKLSPLLWKKIRYGLSAGRVQSVAVRFVVEREKERDGFDAKEYYHVISELLRAGKPEVLSARLSKIDGESIEVREKFKLFTGEYRASRTLIGTQEEAESIISDLSKSAFLVTGITKKKVVRVPPPPFTTSTLQQVSSGRLGFSPKRTMRAAQNLYEKGLITYMRTDSTSIGSRVIEDIRNRVKDDYGAGYLSKAVRRYKTKSKVAQEAHEAIRPTDLVSKSGKALKLAGDEKKLYGLIYNRTIATQMAEARFDATKVTIEAEGASGKKYEFEASGITKTFDGYQKVSAGGNNTDKELPALEEGEKLKPKNLYYDQKYMNLPPRYTEASLIKELEKFGIGRPSTYAPIVSTIKDRGYVVKKEGQLVPEEIGKIVTTLLVENFSAIVDIGFTSKLEDELDDIANGKKKWVPVVREFYAPFEKDLEKASNNIKKSDLVVLEEMSEKCPECGKNLVVKLGKYGKFISCSGFPECKYGKPVDDESKDLDKGQLGACPECGNELQLRRGRFGKFVACTKYPKCKFTKQYIEKVGMKCPDCKEGEVITRKTRKGRMFYGCSNYPKCKFASWKIPK